MSSVNNYRSYGSWLSMASVRGSLCMSLTVPTNCHFHATCQYLVCYVARLGYENQNSAPTLRRCLGRNWSGSSSSINREPELTHYSPCISNILERDWESESERLWTNIVLWSLYYHLRLHLRWQRSRIRSLTSSEQSLYVIRQTWIIFILL